MEKLVAIMVTLTDSRMTRERSLTITKLEEAVHWLHADECKNFPQSNGKVTENC